MTGKKDELGNHMQKFVKNTSFIIFAVLIIIDFLIVFASIFLLPFFNQERKNGIEDFYSGWEFVAMGSEFRILFAVIGMAAVVILFLVIIVEILLKFHLYKKAENEKSFEHYRLLMGLALIEEFLNTVASIVILLLSGSDPSVFKTLLKAVGILIGVYFSTGILTLINLIFADECARQEYRERWLNREKNMVDKGA